ncbi:methyl-accepting chemotaxis protein [Paenibacillus sp. Soil724D2]|uniref:methyl-accepting chemotaxis protein n=1 Tax=Paenibacillus sp. (strain Soil724D2) TaxID=1736392 RepID=UPI00071484E2|nr:methyl-accepting chemotaxis protein [Paenibacillus sp. Soil724D2]KRE46947.1 hypothetical protein ASG85_28265 [Paenibacillus sp. Soil724D2]
MNKVYDDSADELSIHHSWIIHSLFGRNWHTRLTVRTKIFTVFAIIFLMIGGLSWTDMSRMGTLKENTAVVASEVRKLASQTDDSVRDISELISNIQRDSARAGQVMDKGLSEVQEGLKEVGIAELAFGQIVNASQEVASKIQETAAAAQQMAASSEEVSATVASVGSVAQQTSGTAQSVAAATEEQLASTEEITASAESLAGIAQDLHQVVSSFRIS